MSEVKYSYKDYGLISNVEGTTVVRYGVVFAKYKTAAEAKAYIDGMLMHAKNPAARPKRINDELVQAHRAKLSKSSP